MWLKNVKNTVPWTYVISDLNEEESVWMFFKKELEKASQIKMWIGEVIKRKVDQLQLYIKWKGFHNSFNSRLDKKDLVT